MSKRGELLKMFSDLKLSGEEMLKYSGREAKAPEKQKEAVIDQILSELKMYGSPSQTEN